MILVTGAAGKTGSAVIRALASRNQAIRALVRRPEQRQAMIELGAKEAVAGDLGDWLGVERAVDGVDRLYHICPNVDPREIEYADLLISAAKSAGVQLFGYHSVLHPQTEKMTHHWNKLRVEERLFESGLAYTIIQPCAYMQNLLTQRNSIDGNGTIRVPYSLEAKISMVDLQDVAEAIATVLCQAGHVGAIYELAGPEALDHLQVATELSKLIGRKVQAEQMDLGEWTSEARRTGLSDYSISALGAMFAYYDRFGFQGNSNVLALLLGGQPTTLRRFLKREMPG